MTLKWEDAGTGYPGDQNADTTLYPHGYWSLGPVEGGRWGVEVIEQDENLDEITTGGAHLGHFTSEAEAKAAAERHESMRGRWDDPVLGEEVPWDMATEDITDDNDPTLAPGWPWVSP